MPRNDRAVLPAALPLFLGPPAVQYGWGRLGAFGPDWREANKGGWSTLLPHFIAAV
jgi:hypothetical protein